MDCTKITSESDETRSQSLDGFNPFNIGDGPSPCLPIHFSGFGDSLLHLHHFGINRSWRTSQSQRKVSWTYEKHVNTGNRRDGLNILYRFLRFYLHHEQRFPIYVLRIR